MPPCTLRVHWSTRLRSTHRSRADTPTCVQSHPLAATCCGRPASPHAQSCPWRTARAARRTQHGRPPPLGARLPPPQPLGNHPRSPTRLPSAPHDASAASTHTTHPLPSNPHTVAAWTSRSRPRSRRRRRSDHSRRRLHKRRESKSSASWVVGAYTHLHQMWTILALDVAIVRRAEPAHKKDKVLKSECAVVSSKWFPVEWGGEVPGSAE